MQSRGFFLLQLVPFAIGEAWDELPPSPSMLVAGTPLDRSDNASGTSALMLGLPTRTFTTTFDTNSTHHGENEPYSERALPANMHGCCYNVGFGKLMRPIYGDYHDSTLDECDTKARKGGATVFETKSCTVLRAEHRNSTKRAGQSSHHNTNDEELNKAVGKCVGTIAKEEGLDANTCGMCFAMVSSNYTYSLDTLTFGASSSLGFSSRRRCTCGCSRALLRALRRIDPECCEVASRVAACMDFSNVRSAMDQLRAQCTASGDFSDVASELGFGRVQNSFAAERDGNGSANERAFGESLAQALRLAHQLEEAAAFARVEVDASDDRLEEKHHNTTIGGPRMPKTSEFEDVAAALGFTRDAQTDEVVAKGADAEVLYAQRLAKALTLAHKLGVANELIQNTPTQRNELLAKSLHASRNFSDDRAAIDFSSVAEALGFVGDTSDEDESLYGKQLAKALILAKKLRAVNAVIINSAFVTTTPQLPAQSSRGHNDFEAVAESLGFGGEVGPLNKSEKEAVYAAGLANSLALANTIQRVKSLFVNARSTTPTPSTTDGNDREFFAGVAKGLGFGRGPIIEGGEDNEKEYTDSLAEAMEFADNLSEANNIVESSTRDSNMLPSTAGPLVACAEEVRFCADGSPTPRNRTTCEWLVEQCPKVVACSREMRLCSDGSVMPREQASCKWLENECPVVCTMEMRLCPDGSPTPRDSRTCEWLSDKCPKLPVKCALEAKLCPDGSPMPRAPAPGCKWYSQACPQMPELLTTTQELSRVSWLPLAGSGLRNETEELAGWLSFRVEGVSSRQVSIGTAAALAQSLHVPVNTVQVRLAAYSRRVSQDEIVDQQNQLPRPQQKLRGAHWSPTYVVSVPPSRVAEVKDAASEINADPSIFAESLGQGLIVAGAQEELVMETLVVTGFSPLTSVSTLSGSSTPATGVRGIYQRMVENPGGTGQLRFLSAASMALVSILAFGLCVAFCRRPRHDYRRVDDLDPPPFDEQPHFVVIVCFGRTFEFF